MALIWSLRFQEKSTMAKKTTAGLAPLILLLSVNLYSKGKMGILQKTSMDWNTGNGYGEPKRNWKGYNWTDTPPIWPWNKTGTNEIAPVKI